MKKNLVLLLSFSSALTPLNAQQVVLDLDTRIQNSTPRLELFDSAPAENRLEGFLDENSNSIRFVSLIDDIEIISADDVEINADSITFGKSTARRTDFTFHHDFKNNQQAGLTIENNGTLGNNPGHRWSFYVNNSNGRMSLLRNGAEVGVFAVNGVYTASNRNLKKNITPLNSVLSKLMSLKPSSYDYLDSPDAKSKSVGFIGQELNEYFPEFVANQPDDTGEASYMVNYAGMSVIAIKAIQEQQVIIDDLKNQVEELIERISKLEKD